MFTVPPDGDPVAFHFFVQLGTFLRRGPGPLNDDLLERAAVATAASCEEDNGEATTALRVSWCCRVASDTLMAELLADWKLRLPNERVLFTVGQLTAMDTAVAEVEKSILIDRAEYTMGDPEATRGPAQLWHEKLQKLTRESALLRETLGYARTYMQGIKSAAGAVGGTFFYFLTEHGRTRDELVTIGEELITVHT